MRLYWLSFGADFLIRSPHEYTVTILVFVTVNSSDFGACFGAEGLISANLIGADWGLCGLFGVDFGCNSDGDCIGGTLAQREWYRYHTNRKGIVLI